MENCRRHSVPSSGEHVAYCSCPRAVSSSSQLWQPSYTNPTRRIFFIRIWWEEFLWRSQLNLASSRQASVNRGKNNLVPRILHAELGNSSLAPRACPSPSLVCFSRAVLTHLQQGFSAQCAGVDCWPWGGRSLEEHVFMIMESFQHWDFVVYSNKWSFSTCSLEVILFPWAMF